MVGEPAPGHGNATELMLRARSTLQQAGRTDAPDQQFVLAHVAALRAAAALVALRTPPASSARPRRRRPPRDVWTMLVERAPEFASWADFFAAQSSRRAHVEAGIGEPVTVAQAYQTLLQAEAFLDLVASVMGVSVTSLAFGEPVRAATG